MTSPIGRTKTTPAATDLVTKIGLAVYSCSNFPFGFFNAFGNPARKDSVDYVIHLGDYIYEYKNGDYGYGQSIRRVPLPDRAIFTLYDYRKRIATYRTDLDLLLSHEMFPWIPVWVSSSPFLLSFFLAEGYRVGSHFGECMGNHTSVKALGDPLLPLQAESLRLICFWR